MKKPTLIFVHGAWHTPECWEKVIANLEPKGYKCIAPQMLFCGTPEPISSLDPCIDQLQDIISAETAAGNDVVMVAHSFGGVSGSSAVKGFTAKNSSRPMSRNDGKVIGIALLTAMVVPTGFNFHEFYSKGEPKHTVLAAPAGDGWSVLIRDPFEVFYQDIPEEEAKRWVGLLKKQSIGPLGSKDGVYSGWLDVPLWYLLCEKDAAIESPFQERMVGEAKKLGSQVEVRRIESGHSPFLSRVEETVRFLSDAATAMSRQVPLQSEVVQL